MATTERCPWCGSTITHAKFVQIQAAIREDERKKLHGLDGPIVATFGYDGGSVEVAASRELVPRLLGPFFTEDRPRSSASA